MRTNLDFKATDFLRQSAEPLGPPPRMGVRLSPVFRSLHRRRRRGPACAQGRLGQEAADAALGMAPQPARKRALRGGVRVSADKRRSPPAGTSAGLRLSEEFGRMAETCVVWLTAAVARERHRRRTRRDGHVARRAIVSASVFKRSARIPFSPTTSEPASSTPKLSTRRRRVHVCRIVRSS